jgi:hypothetical protein
MQTMNRLLPAVIIEPVAGRSEEIALGAMDQELTVSVAVFAKGDTPDNAADASVLSQAAVFGKYARIHADVTNTNPVKITVIGILK